MRVLVALIPMPSDRVVGDLNGGLKALCDLVHDHERFWRMEGTFDIVHIHFPEYMTFDLEACLDSGVSQEMLAAVEKRLQFWRKRAAIVVTRHVFLPHRRQDLSVQRLYELVYRHADAVVHLGEESQREYGERYRLALAGVPQRHMVIRQQNYASLPNTIDRTEARRRLGLRPDAKVLLVFGGIQSDEERSRILGTFRRINVPGKVLLVSSWRERLPAVKWVRLKYWLRDLTRFYYRLHRRYCFHYGFVRDEEVQLYLNAADVVFIPRAHVLNSGNMILGFTFGRVVVGPSSGVIREILSGTGNPVYDPGCGEATVAAVERGFTFAEQGLGARNRSLALSEWTVEKAAARYAQLFRELMASRTGRLAASREV